MRDIAVGIVIGLLMALLIAWGRRLRELPGAVARFVLKALLPALLLAVFVGALGGAVALARRAHIDDQQWWAQGIAAGFLMGITLLLFATGDKQHTATARLTLGKTKTIKAGDEITDAEVEKLVPSDRDGVTMEYKATSDFTVPGQDKTVAQGDQLESKDFEALPEAERDKLELIHTVTRRVTWRTAEGDLRSADAGGTIAADDYAKLDESAKKRVRISYRAKTDVSYSLSRTIKAGEIVDDGDLIAFPDLVKQNSSSVRRATRDLAIAETGEGSKVIGEGQRVPAEDYARLSAGEKETVTSQRGLYFRGLVVGTDGRWSTSKLQALLWTYAVLYGLVSLFVFGELLHHDLDLGTKHLSTFGEMELQEQYLLLLGGPFAAAVIAKATTTSKVADGSLAKAPDDGSGTVNGLREVISNDSGRTDLLDFQYFFFNVVALLVFAVAFVSDFEKGFPVLPWFLVGLTGTSALAYTTKKALESNQPNIMSVVPERVRPGEQVRIQGSFLITPPAHKPAITVAGRAVPPENIVIDTAEVRDDLQTIAMTIPADTIAGDDQRLIVIPEASSARLETKVDILGPVIASVQPSSATLLPGEELRIFGENFGPQPPGDDAVTLGPLKLVVVDWRDNQITVTLPAQLAKADGLTGDARLHIVDGHRRPAETTVALSRPETKIEDVVPSTVRLTEKPEVTVVGEGFGDEAGQAFVGDWRLEILDWQNRLIRGRFVPENIDQYEEAKPVSVRVQPVSGPPGAKEIKVQK